MAKKFSFFERSKTRNLAIVFGIVVIVAIIAVMFFMRKGSDVGGGLAKVSKVPRGMDFVPGTKKLPKEYLKTLLQSENISAQKALKTGGSAIPSLLATNNQSQGMAGTELTEQSKGHSITQCCDAMKKVCQLRTTANLLDRWAKTGQIAPDVAAQLGGLHSKQPSVSDYAVGLNRLVSNGKLTPAQARQLLAAYRQEHAAVAVQPPAQQEHSGIRAPSAANALLDQMVKAGTMSSSDAALLKQLQSLNVPVRTYKATLDRLVKAGKLPANQASQLLSAYRQEVVSVPPVVSRPSMPSASTSGILNGLVSSGKITSEAADQLRSISQSGGSAVDYGKTLNQLVRSGKLQPSDALKLLSAYQSGNPTAGVPEGTGQVAQLERQQQQRELARQKTALQQQQVTMRQQRTQQQVKSTQTMVKDLETAMNTQTHSLVAAWNPVPQKYVFHAASSDQDGNNVHAGSQSAGNKAGSTKSMGGKRYPMIKSGDIMFAVLDTGLNSDRPGPVMATIVSGRFKGAKLMGGLNVTPDHERVILKFTSMTMSKWPDTIRIDAVAINPDTAHTAIASKVDHHYMLRYSAIFASSFLSGVADAVKNSGSTTVQDSGSSKTTYTDLNVGEKLMVGIGEIGTKLSRAAEKVFNKKPTVKVDAGVGLGILFTGSVSQSNF